MEGGVHRLVEGVRLAVAAAEGVFILPDDPAIGVGDDEGRGGAGAFIIRRLGDGGFDVEGFAVRIARLEDVALAQLFGGLVFAILRLEEGVDDVAMLRACPFVASEGLKAAMPLDRLGEAGDRVAHLGDAHGGLGR